MVLLARKTYDCGRGWGQFECRREIPEDTSALLSIPKTPAFLLHQVLDESLVRLSRAPLREMILRFEILCFRNLYA